MTSQKQRNANRLNARRSSGPKSDAGRIRSSINARKHGLTSSIETSDWSSKIQPLVDVLSQDGLSFGKCRSLAKAILEFERNIDYQRKRFLNEQAGSSSDPNIPDSALEDLELAKIIQSFMDSGRLSELSMDNEMARDVKSFFEYTAKLEIRQAHRDGAK